MWSAGYFRATIGYGDIAPTALLGRVIAVLLMLVGIGLMSTLAESIASYFVQQNASSELKDLADRLERIEAILAWLSRESSGATEGEMSAVSTQISAMSTSVHHPLTDKESARQ